MTCLKALRRIRLRTPNQKAMSRHRPSLALELGGPWAFYRSFWQAHGIEHLAKLYAPEAQVVAGEKLWVPLIIRNDTDSSQRS